MKTRKIGTCQLCGKARLASALTDGLCAKCQRACERFPDDTITLAGLNRLLDDLDDKGQKNLRKI